MFAPEAGAAIDVKRLACHEVGIARREVCDQMGHFLCGAEPVQRIGLLCVVEELGRVLLGAAGDDHTRSHRVDPDAMKRPFHRERLGHVVDAGACGTRVQHARKPTADLGDDVDDPPSLLRDHGFVGDRVRHAPGADEIVANDCGEALRRERLGGRRELPAGVVDQYVDAPKALEHRVYESSDRIRLSDVARGAKRLDTLGLELGYRTLQRVRPPSADRHLGAQEAHFCCGGEPNTRPTSGDQDHFVREQPIGVHLIHAAAHTTRGVAVRPSASRDRVAVPRERRDELPQVLRKERLRERGLDVEASRDFIPCSAGAQEDDGNFGVPPAMAKLAQEHLTVFDREHQVDDHQVR